MPGLLNCATFSPLRSNRQPEILGATQAVCRLAEIEQLTIAIKISKKTKRWLGATLATVFVLWLGFMAYVDWAMHQPPEGFGHVMARMPMPAYFIFPFETMWTDARKGTLNAGDQAPDFTVKTLDTKVPVKLASLWVDKPVVLVFGSYT
jgi:hypothetical protein